MLLVAFLALLGVNLTGAITKRTEIEKIINLSFVPLGAFLITFGVFGEEWYESTPIHDVWETILAQFNLISPHGHFGEEWWNVWANLMLLLMIVVPFALYYGRRRSGIIKIVSGK